jgi:hypothetical protein
MNRNKNHDWGKSETHPRMPSLTRKKNMKNEVTAYGILKALSESNSACNAHLVAVHANIDTTSENLQKITDELYDFASLGFVEVRMNEYRKQPWFRVTV